MTPATFGYEIIFSREGITQPAIYAYFSDFADRNEIARVVWQHAESALREAGADPDPHSSNMSYEELLGTQAYKIVSYKTLRGS